MFPVDNEFHRLGHKPGGKAGHPEREGLAALFGEGGIPGGFVDIEAFVIGKDIAEMLVVVQKDGNAVL